MEICRFTHAERRPRLQTAIVLKSHPRKTTRRVAQGLSWNGKQPDSDTEREEVKQKIESGSKNDPSHTAEFYRTPSAKYDHRGTGEFHQCPIIQVESDTY